MTGRKPPRPEKNSDTAAIDLDRPEVIVEVLFERGLLLISVHNIGNRPALSISVKFNKKIVGLNGKKEISALALFNSLEFLGPGREVVTLLDTSDSYFRRKQPTKISAVVSYKDSEQRKYEVTINHNLEVYRELPYLMPDSSREREP